jgi:hypothetical protein
MNNIISNFEESLNKVYNKKSNIEEQYITLKNKINDKKMEINDLEVQLNSEKLNLKIIQESENTDNREKNIKILENNIKILNARFEKQNNTLNSLRKIFEIKEEAFNKKYFSIINNKNKVINQLRDYQNQWNEWFDENVKTIEEINKLKKEINKEKSIVEKIFKEKGILMIEKSKLQKILLSIKDEIIKTIEDKKIYLLKKENNINKKQDEYIELKKQKEQDQLPDKIENKDEKELQNLLFENEKNVKRQLEESHYTKNLTIISNIFWRINKTIKILDKYFEENVDKTELLKEFKNVKKNINNIIDFIDIKRFNNIMKTKYKLTDEELSNIEIVINYWNENKNTFFHYNSILVNIYEYLFNKTRIILKTNTVENIENDKLVIPCKKIDYEQNLYLDKKFVYESYDIEWTPENIFKGTLLNENTKDNEKKNLNDIIKLLQEGFSISLLNMGNINDKQLLLNGNSWNKGLINYFLELIENLNGIIKIKEVWELYNDKTEVENNVINNKINVIKDSKILKTLFNKFIKNNRKIQKDDGLIIDLDDYFKNRNNSILFIHLQCKFENIKSNLVIVDFPEITTPENVFKQYLKDDISLPNIMYTNDIKYIKLYNKTTEDPKIILNKLKYSYFITEIVNHLKYYFKKLNTNQRLKVIFNKNLEEYNSNNFFIDPYLEFKNDINEENNCLIIPLMNYINEIISKHNKYILLSVLNDNNCKETELMIDFINNIS